MYVYVVSNACAVLLPRRYVVVDFLAAAHPLPIFPPKHTRTTQPPPKHTLLLGDFNTVPERHLSGATIERLSPDLLITESTYATSLRDDRRSREHTLLQLVWYHERTTTGRLRECCVQLVSERLSGLTRTLPSIPHDAGGVTCVLHPQTHRCTTQ